MDSTKKCEIVDDEEMEKIVSNPFNFRRFDVEELQRRSSPFEKGSNQKKEFPFLFQKKKSRNFEEKKISIDELMNKVNSLNMNVEKYEHHTPEWPKTTEEIEAVHEELIEYYRDLKKKEEIEKEVVSTNGILSQQTT